MRPPLVLVLTLCLPLAAQNLPMDKMAPSDRVLAQDVISRANFSFSTRTEPKRVRSETMEKLFDHPRMSVAMWRQCQFVPNFFVQDLGRGEWRLDDLAGLKAHMRLIYAQPGWRIYLAEGVADKGRLKVPFSVSARMVASYRYWEDDKGFESDLSTWTALDSALLGFMARPFYGAIKERQDKFIAYISGNIATFGEFAEGAPRDFLEPLQRDGDPEALRDYESLFVGRR